MFQRRRGSLKRAMEKASDPEMRQLEDEIADRKGRIAQLQLEISETRADMARFEYEMEVRLGGFMRRLQELRDLLNEARRKAAWKAQWGDRQGSPEMEQDVVEQFHRSWQQRPRPPKPPPEVKLSEAELKDLKALFYALAKRFHPDLVTDLKEKKRREAIMIQVNEAYAAKDLQALRELTKKPDVTLEEPVKTREQILAQLGNEINRLERVVMQLNDELRGLIHTNEVVRLMLDVSIARQRGQDLVAEMAADMKIEISRLELELAQLQSED